MSYLLADIQPLSLPNRTEDYFYRSIDGGKSCVISAVLSNGKNYAELCLGENLEYIKYLDDPKSD